MEKKNLFNTFCLPSYEVVLFLEVPNENHYIAHFSSLVKSNEHDADLVCYTAIHDKLQYNAGLQKLSKANSVKTSGKVLARTLSF